MTRSHNVYSQLVGRMRDLARDTQKNHGTGVELFTVRQVTPSLILEELGGDLILEDGDDDFVVGAWLRQFMINYTLEVGDQVTVAHIGGHWRTIDVADPGGQGLI